MSTLADVSILVTSFLRAGYLLDCMASIKQMLPECSVVVVDDGDLDIAFPDPSAYADWRLVRLPFDSGLSAKRNAGVRAATEKYVLLGCDDFDFGTKEARQGIDTLLRVLDANPDIAIAGGRVDGRSYEGYLEYNHSAGYIKETRLDTAGMKSGDFKLCDLTVNYFLGRTEVLGRCPWPEECKIGGEHCCLFLDLKLVHVNVAYVHGVNINTFPFDQSKQDPRYAEYRGRARTLGHPLMKKRYNILDYIGFAGDVS